MTKNKCEICVTCNMVRIAVGFACAMSILLLLAGCTTPRTMMQNPKTGDTAACGGNTSSSLQGGAIGYHIQKQRDAECVADLEARGYKVEEVK